MLCLMRKQDECIQIGEDIRITVASIQGGRVKLGIEAPEHIRISRIDQKPAKQITTRTKEGCD